MLVLRNTLQIDNLRIYICGDSFQLGLSEVTRIESEINPFAGQGNNPELWLADTTADLLAFSYINLRRHTTNPLNSELSHDISADIPYEPMGCRSDSLQKSSIGPGRSDISQLSGKPPVFCLRKCIKPGNIRFNIQYRCFVDQIHIPQM